MQAEKQILGNTHITTVCVCVCGQICL